MSSFESPSRVRWLVVFAAMSMAVLLYLDRFCVSLAADYIREDLRLTQKQIGWFMGAFFYSYALAQVPAGWLSDRFGARIMLVIYILSWSVFTAMIGAVYSFLLLMAARLACGLGQAGAYPTSASIVSKWVPFSERGMANAVIAFGGRVGGRDRAFADRLPDRAVRADVYFAFVRGIATLGADFARRQTRRENRIPHSGEPNFLGTFARSPVPLPGCHQGSNP